MAEAQVVPVVMHPDPVVIELWRPIGIPAATARAASAWAGAAAAEAVYWFTHDVLLPYGVELDVGFVDEDGDVADEQPPDEQRLWRAVANEDLAGWGFDHRQLDRFCQVRGMDRAVEEDALLVLVDRALAVEPPRSGMSVAWTGLRVAWTRTWIPDGVDVGFPASIAATTAGSDQPPILVDIERERGAWLVSHPSRRGRGVLPPITIDVRQEGRHADARVVLRVGLHWSWWRDEGSPGEPAIDDAVAWLTSFGWRPMAASATPAPAGPAATQPVPDEEAIRLGRVSVDSTPSPAAFPVGATVGGGRFVVDAVLEHRMQGYRCTGREVASGAEVLITVRGGESTPFAESYQRLGYVADGVAELLHIGPVDGHDRRVAVIEARPDGAPLTEVPLPLEPEVAIGIARHVVAAMRAAHGVGALLREVRPELIYVTGGPSRPAFSGFAPRAMAVLLAGTDDSGETVSYPYPDPYLAPELVEGRAPGTAGDVFSLGAALAHWLSGDYPFAGATFVERLLNIHRGGRQPWRGPARWTSVVDAALAADPAARPTVDELERALHDAVTPTAPPPMDDFVAAIREGEYERAYDGLVRSEHAATDGGIATAAVLLALLGRYQEAEQRLAAVDAPAIRVIVRGEWERSARWLRPDSAQQLAATAQLPFVPLYAAMASALVARDAQLAERVKADLARSVAPIAGRVRFASGEVAEFHDLADADDAIGQMLETYAGTGLLYFPFAALRRVTMLPPGNIVDSLVPQAELVTADGRVAQVRVPLVYATSTTSPDRMVRIGRVTNFDYIGTARRALGMRDLVLDGGRFVGLVGISSIEFGAGA